MTYEYDQHWEAFATGLRRALAAPERDLGAFLESVMPSDTKATVSQLATARDILGKLCEALRGGDGQLWERLGDVHRLLYPSRDEAPLVVHTGPAAFSVGQAVSGQVSPWAVGSRRDSDAPPQKSHPEGMVPVAPRPPERLDRSGPPSLELIAELEATAPLGADAPKRPALPFARPGAGSPPAGAPQGPKLDLEAYAQYCIAREASAERAVLFLAAHGITDASQEDAAWSRRLAEEPETAPALEAEKIRLSRRARR